jgi:hypothetical protein
MTTTANQDNQDNEVPLHNGLKDFDISTFLIGSSFVEPHTPPMSRAHHVAMGYGTPDQSGWMIDELLPHDLGETDCQLPMAPKKHQEIRYQNTSEYIRVFHLPPGAAISSYLRRIAKNGLGQLDERIGKV